MPHRTVFQIGKNHAHPFTMFVGGFVIGAMVTGAVAWAWVMADDSNVQVDSAVKPRSKAVQNSPSPAAAVKPSASPSPTVTF